jgi:mRNA interferase MazF
MGTYVPGDILLACVRLGVCSDCKTRPVVVLRSSPGELLHVCPVSSRPPADAPFLTLAPGDFLEGGLDICEKSYILVNICLRISVREVIGKKGRVATALLESVHSLQGTE